jgi:hypothetical protein
MLTDVFANRYANVPIWSSFGGPERRLLVQGFRILTEHVCPYWKDGRAHEYGKIFWTDLHNRISMELGLSSLSPLAYSYVTNLMGKSHTVTGTWTMNKVCENWMLQTFDGSQTPDVFIKERLSLVEIGFRKRGETIAEANAQLVTQVQAIQLRLKRKGSGTIQLPGDPANGLRAQNAKLNKEFQDAVDELNTRFVQARCSLNYHNGFIQCSADVLSEEEIEKPFWALVADPQWKNVDLDMKEALDQRDSGSRDPAFYAARALESTIKIISDLRRLTHGGEKGAHNFIDNLASQRAAFIAPWEGDTLKHFFTKVRNPMGHGPGSGSMSALNEHQTTWAIEFCMTWIKSLIRRITNA